jgi:NADPH:quinone reductase-like Zn-dependent oxidoreductase
MRHKRIIVTRYGGPDELQVVEEECPEPKNGEVRVRVLAAGVSLPDVMAREGVHPETPPVPFTPGWDLVGVVDLLGNGTSGVEPGQTVAALPIHGAYAEFVCLPQRELVPVPSGLDVAEAVSLVLNYITAYQMLHRSAKVRSGRRVLIHGAAGGVGTAAFGLCIAAGWLLPGRKRVVPYSIQTLKRLKPELFRQDLIALLDLLKQRKIKPLIAQRFPLAEARQAHELLGKGGVTGKFVLMCNESSLESAAA